MPERPLPAHGEWCATSRGASVVGMKGKGWRKKRSTAQGHACPNPACNYHGIRDQAIRALVLQEIRGKTDRVRRLRCQACGKRFSVQHDTVLAHLKTPPDRIELALTLLAEGVDIAASTLGRKKGQG